MSNSKTVLHIIELGEYPDLLPVFERNTLEIHQVHSMRKGLSTLNRLQPDIIVAEFNYLPTYGSQISNVESLLAKIQSHAPDTKIILFYHTERKEHLDRLSNRFPIFASLAYPLSLELLDQTLQHAVR